MLYTVIIPCYKSSLTIRKVVLETMEQFEQMKRGDVEFVLVDDCSPDGGATVRELRNLVEQYPNVLAVELAKNAGQHNAQMAALNYAKGDIIISMDDDGQTSPTQLPRLLDEMDKGFDIVYAYYPHKEHSGGRNLGSRFNQWSLRILIGKPKDMKTSSFWVIRRFVRDYAIQYKSAYTHIQGVFLRVTRNISCVPVEHFKREVGQSGYTLRKLIGLWANIIGFSIVPLRIATVLGYLFSAAGLIGIICVVVRKIVRPVTAIGWPSVMVAILFFSGLILLFMGLIGEYIGRIFLGMSNNPQFVVRQIDGYDQGLRQGNEPDGYPVRKEEAIS
ncbi:MAG TPA: glycosyltransferase [Lachnospiraceae bacterium]|jgi:undecaprenyl-phosphate 4-deoxy-4-formamido-L-arabinose transferase|nr:glycosyltransferase [Lachnospiraceae bacterium]